MANKKVSVVLNENGITKLDELKKWAFKEGSVINGGNFTESGLFNWMLDQMINLFVEQDRSYAGLYHDYTKLSKKEPINHLQRQNQLMFDQQSEIYYLLMSLWLSQANIDVEKVALVKSMFEKQSKENQIHLVLNELIRKDKQKNTNKKLAKGNKIQ